MGFAPLLLERDFEGNRIFDRYSYAGSGAHPSLDYWLHPQHALEIGVISIREGSRVRVCGPEIGTTAGPTSE